MAECHRVFTPHDSKAVVDVCTETSVASPWWSPREPFLCRHAMSARDGDASSDETNSRLYV